MAEETETYQVVLAAFSKIKPEDWHCAVNTAKQDIKVYMLEYGDRLPLMSSSYDENLKEMIEELDKKGIKTFVIGGTPTPPPCSPKGCP